MRPGYLPPTPEGEDWREHYCAVCGAPDGWCDHDDREEDE